MFLVEIALRIRYGRNTWYKDCWNIFDLLLVSIGIVDSWILKFALADGDDNNMRSFTMMRVFKLVRLIRILRLLRLFRFLRELVLLAKGILGSLRALVWTGLLLAIVLFMCGRTRVSTVFFPTR